MANATIAPPTTLENRIIGGVNLLSCILFFALNIPCMVVMRTKSSLWKHSCFQVRIKEEAPLIYCFQLMFHMGVADIINTGTHAFFASFSLFDAVNHIPKW